MHQIGRRWRTDNVQREEFVEDGPGVPRQGWQRQATRPVDEGFLEGSCARGSWEHSKLSCVLKVVLLPVCPSPVFPLLLTRGLTRSRSAFSCCVVCGCNYPRPVVPAGVAVHSILVATTVQLVVDGLPLFGGVQLAVDTTMVSALHANGEARRGAAHTDGVALAAARRRKERTFLDRPWGTRQVGRVGR